MKKLKTVFFSMFLSLTLLLGTWSGAAVEAQATEEILGGTGYSQVNMFTDTYDIKGLQGGKSKNDYGGVSHSLTNIFLDECIFSPDSLYAKRGWADPYVFEGETFYFAKNPRGMPMVQICNGENISLSAVFLLRWDDGSNDPYDKTSDKTFLIDADSRVPGYRFYAPNADLSTYGGRAIRAYWHYIMEYFDEMGYHIDNFILGNEVNMPNHWHYSGSTDVNVVATKYADAFYYLYDAVRKYTNVSRCSISIDHCWTHNDEGRGIGARDFLHAFNNRLAQYGNVDWCISAHAYPAILTDTRIWEHPYGLTPNSPDAAMFDGTNLSVLTNYIRDNFGSQHRVMLTEQGFTNNCGPEAQAACLAYTYYAAMYDPMVDCFLMNAVYSGDQLDFRLPGTLAGEVYNKIGNGIAGDQQWIADVCLPIIGASSWEEIIPNFGYVESVALSEKQTFLKPGETRQLSATVAPGRLADQPLLWQSSDPGVATVDASGVITATGAGTATITAVAKYAKHVTDSCSVTVRQPVESIELNATSHKMMLSETFDLVATILPDNAANKAILWQSSNEAVATVDQNGRVSAVGVGSALITAASCDGTGVSRSCTITVDQPVQKIELSEETLGLFISETHKLSAKVLPDNAVNKAVKWTSSDDTVVTVDQNGNVKAVGVGTVTISVTAQDGSGVIGSCAVTASIEEGNSFYDVLSSKWYYKFVNSACERGFMAGKGKDKATGLIIFEPIANMARAEFVQVLYNIEGKPAVEYADRFTDIPSGQWYTNAVLWAAENGITSGKPDGSFAKYENITREQMAFMLMKYAVMKGYEVTGEADLSGYSDTAKVSSWAKDAINWAVANRIISGTGDGRLNPQGPATRAEAATMLNGFYEKFMTQSE